MDDPPLRVALVSSSYHPHFGGVEEHVRHVARELQTRGHAVEVWTVDRGDGLRDERVDGVRVRYLPTPLPARSAKALGSLAFRAPSALARWGSAYAAFRPGVINVQCFGPNGIYGTLLARLTATPLVVTSHGETMGDEHNVFDQSALLRAGLRSAIQWGTVTACSEYVADDLRARFGAHDVHVVPNAVDLSPRAVAEVTPPPRVRDAPVLIGAGRLVPQKGFDVLLRAAARSKHSPSVWIVGDGAERAALETLARELGLAGRVTFLGRRTAAEVRGLMAAADVVVMPSRVEAFGIVALEAWASGTPLVATHRGGPASFVSHGTDGLLVDPDDLESVTASVDLILGDAAVASDLAACGSQTVRHFTWSQVTDRYALAYGS